MDPSEVKRIEKQQREIVSSNSFEFVAQDWFDRHLSKKAETTKAKVTSRMDRFVLPYIGKRPIAEITAPEILTVVRRVETNGSLDTAHRALTSLERATAHPSLLLRTTTGFPSSLGLNIRSQET